MAMTIWSWPPTAAVIVPPAWLAAPCFQADPQVEVQVGRERRPAQARVVEPGDPTFDRLWTIVNQNNQDRYTAYQHQTSRPIPVVALSPG